MSGHTVGYEGKVTWPLLTKPQRTTITSEVLHKFGNKCKQHFTDQSKHTLHTLVGQTALKPSTWPEAIIDIGHEVKLKPTDIEFKKTSNSLYDMQSVIKPNQLIVTNLNSLVEVYVQPTDEPSSKLRHGETLITTHTQLSVAIIGYDPVELSGTIQAPYEEVSHLIIGELCQSRLFIGYELNGSRWQSNEVELGPARRNTGDGFTSTPLIGDSDYDVARDAGPGDLDYLGSMDDWINCAGLIDQIPNHFQADWLIWGFWVNDMNYRNNRHRGNDKDEHPGKGVDTPGWVTRVVIDGPVVPQSPRITAQPDKVTEQSWENATSMDKTIKFRHTDTHGTSAIATVDKSSSITVDASISFGGFSMNASGTTSSTESKQNTSDNTTTTEVEEEVTIKAMTIQTAKVVISQTNVVTYYVQKITLRGKDDRSTLAVSMMPGHEGDKVAWVNLTKLAAPIGNRTTSNSVFRVEQIVTKTRTSYTETPIKSHEQSGSL
jgi:hypothetical protein